MECAAIAYPSGWSLAASSLSLHSSLQALCSSLSTYVSQLITWAFVRTSSTTSFGIELPLLICTVIFNIAYYTYYYYYYTSSSFLLLLLLIIIIIACCRNIVCSPLSQKNVEVGKIRILTANLLPGSQLSYKYKDNTITTKDFTYTIVCNSLPN